jgi:uncharacterized protein
MKAVSESLREARKKCKLTLQKVAVKTRIDVGILSKIERGIRPISTDQLKTLSELYQLNFNQLKKNLTAEHIVAIVAYENNPGEILKLAEQLIQYETKPFKPLDQIIKELTSVFKKFKEVQQAWLFGSYSRGEMTSKSDIDIVISADKGFTYFQLADVQYQTENKLGIKVDIGFKKSLDPVVQKNAEKDMKLIYGKRM